MAASGTLVADGPGLFSDPQNDAPDKGLGGATAVELGLQVNDEHGFANTTIKNLSPNVSGQFYENDLLWDGNALDALGLNNPGNSPYGGLVDSEELDAVGHQIDSFLGSIFFNSNNSGLGHELFTFSAGRPATDSNFGGLTIEVNIDGGYGGKYRLTQNGVNFDIPDADDFFSLTIQAGDANLDGTVDGEDLSIFESSFGGVGNWSDGDITGEGLVNGTDFLVWQRNFSGAASQAVTLAVPEPSSIIIIVMSLLSILPGPNRYFRGMAFPRLPLR